MYDTYDPLKWDLKHKISINEVTERCIVDVDFSQDETLIAYTNKTMTAKLIDLTNLAQIHNIYFSDRENSYLYHNQANSIKISGDGKEIIAGSS